MEHTTSIIEYSLQGKVLGLEPLIGMESANRLLAGWVG